MQRGKNVDFGSGPWWDSDIFYSRSEPFGHGHFTSCPSVAVHLGMTNRKKTNWLSCSSQARRKTGLKQTCRGESVWRRKGLSSTVQVWSGTPLLILRLFQQTRSSRLIATSRRGAGLTSPRRITSALAAMPSYLCCGVTSPKQHPHPHLVVCVFSRLRFSVPLFPFVSLRCALGYATASRRNEELDPQQDVIDWTKQRQQQQQ